MESGSKATPLNLGHLFLVISDVRLLGGLGTTALGLKDHVETRTCRVDGQVLSVRSTVRADLRRLVVCSIVHFDVVERTAAYTESQTHVTDGQTDRQTETGNSSLTLYACIGLQLISFDDC